MDDLEPWNALDDEADSLEEAGSAVHDSLLTWSNCKSGTHRRKS